VLRLVLGHGLRLTLAGVVLGLAASFALTRFLSSLLLGVTSTDALTFSSIAILLCAVALFACFIPARRAMRVDPIVALRYE
jgi:putative ABC transport system permease protein